MIDRTDADAPIDDATLLAVADRYRTRRPDPLAYGTVRDYCDSFDHLHALATLNGDLKDLQRPWVFKAVVAAAGGRHGRLLEIGAGEPVVAHLLERLGHEVWVVDPYDGSGNGPVQFGAFRSLYPGLTFVREVFTESSPLPADYFDCIYSISVLEHIPEAGLRQVMAGMKRFSRSDGFSVHAVDHVLRGGGAEEDLARLRLMVQGWGFFDQDLARIRGALSADTDTYYLSAESHNRWRAGLPYDEYPMRVCVSVHAFVPTGQLTVPGGELDC